MAQASNRIVINSTLQIPRAEIEFNYVRSSGPGGQNVNKTNSKAELRWNVFHSPCLSDLQRKLIQNSPATKLSLAGEIIITSNRFRDQIRNKEDCLEKFIKLIRQALHRPMVRKKTKPSLGSKAQRLNQKTLTGKKKKMRGKVKFED